MNSQMPESVGETRASFMRRVRDAVARGKGSEEQQERPEIDDALVRLIGKEDDVVAVFCKRAAAMGMAVVRVDQHEVVAGVVQILATEEARRVMVGMADAEAMEHGLREAGCGIMDWRDATRIGEQFDADAGVTDGLGVAETGTVVCEANRTQARGLSLVVRLHVVVIKASRIMADMLDYWSQWTGTASRAMPSSIAMITGPSKTADIEGILVTGVHGPGQVHILIVDDA